MASMPSSFRNYIYTLRPQDVGHWPAPAVTKGPLTNVGSDNRSEDFIPVPNSSQGTVGHDMGVCAICLPRPSLNHRQTGHAGWSYRQNNVHHAVSRLFHMCSVWTCSHLWREQGASGGPYGPVQLSLCNCRSPGVSFMLLRLCWETQQIFLWPYGCAIRSWTTCATWSGCRYYLMLPVVTRDTSRTQN